MRRPTRFDRELPLEVRAELDSRCLGDSYRQTEILDWLNRHPEIPSVRTRPFSRSNLCRHSQRVRQEAATREAPGLEAAREMSNALQIIERAARELKELVNAVLVLVESELNKEGSRH